MFYGGVCDPPNPPIFGALASGGGSRSLCVRCGRCKARQISSRAGDTKTTHLCFALIAWATSPTRAILAMGWEVKTPLSLGPKLSAERLALRETSERLGVGEVRKRSATASLSRTVDWRFAGGAAAPLAWSAVRGLGVRAFDAPMRLRVAILTRLLASERLSPISAAPLLPLRRISPRTPTPLRPTDKTRGRLQVAYPPPCAGSWRVSWRP